jgi:hypothetical protein
MTKIRIPARVADHLLSTEPAYTPESDPELARVLKVIRGTQHHADGSYHIDVTDRGELDSLQVYVEAMATGARDNAHDPDGLADFNAAKAVLRALAKRSTL